MALVFLTNGGGLGVLAVDFCEEFGIKMPALTRTTIQTLKQESVLRGCNLTKNPLDILGDALSSRYEAALQSLLIQPDIYGALVLQGVQ